MWGDMRDLRKPSVDIPHDVAALVYFPGNDGEDGDPCGDAGDDEGSC